MKFHSSQEGARLGTLVSDRVKLSRALVKRSIERGGCRVNGRVERFASHRLSEGDLIEFCLIEPQAGLWKTLYEDEDLLVLDKPMGVSSDHPLAVHRLDKPTTGVLVRAKNEKTKEAMERLFEERLVHKVYHAYVLGTPSEEAIMQDYLSLRGTYEGQKMYGVSRKGKKAVTAYTLLEAGPISKLELRPQTGRMHQLRVQLAHRGFPILGDTQYARGSKAGFGYPRLMLHAYSIAFKHPLSGRDILVVAEPDESFCKQEQHNSRHEHR